MKFCLPPWHDLLLSLLFSVAITAAALPGAQAQQPLSSEQANEAALALMNDGKLPEAAAAFEDILKKYPTSTIIPDVQYRLANVYYLLAKYDKSRAYIDKITRPPAPEDIMELGFGLLPQMLAAKAEKEKDPKARDAGYEEAIKQYDAFLKKYPASTQVENIVYCRALAYYQIGKYEQASETLQANLKQFPKSETILESQMLLAISEMTRGCLLAQATPGEANAKADQAFDESERLLTDIVKRHTDASLVNDAQIHLGELNANRALFAPEAAKPALYAKGLDAYRSLIPKQTALNAQKTRIKQLQERRLAALTAKNIPAMKALDAMVNHEVEKLAALNSKGDLTLTALLKSGQLYLQKNACDEARFIFREMQPFAQTEDQKKDLLYHLTLSYTQQIPKLPADLRPAFIQKAVENYESFQENYKGDEIANTLPYLIGNLLLPTNPKKALTYYDEEISLYPKGPVGPDTILRQARAFIELKQFDKALATFQKFLSGNPKREIAAEASYGIADILRENGKTAQALTEYTKIASTYKGLPQAEAASFWVAKLHFDQSALDSAISEFSAFLKDFPKSDQTPLAAYYLAKAYSGKNDPSQAARYFKEVTDQFPKSQPAPFAYFDRVSLLQGPGKAADRAALMHEFLQRYPDSDKAYFAYNILAQDLIATKKTSEAIDLYKEMVEKHPGDPQSALALFNIAALWFQQTNALGRYYGLSEAQRTQWVETINNSLAATEELITHYPESEQLANALQYTLLNEKRLGDAQLKTDDDITTYFQDLAAKFTDKPATRSKILFTLASFTFEKDPAKALSQMKAAYDPKLLYAPADIDLYGGALLKSGALNEAAAVYQKLAADYPNPDPGHPEKAPLQIQQAQSVALYGQAKILQQQGKIPQAAEKFETYKSLYPNFSSVKLLAANYAIAQAAHEAGQSNKADPLLVQIFRSTSADPELRANAMLLHAKIRAEKKELAPAIDENLKIAVLFEAAPKAAAEALWRGAQLLEQQAATLPQTSQNPKDPTKPGQLQKALKTYQDLVAKYANSPHAAEAKARVAALQNALK